MDLFDFLKSKKKKKAESPGSEPADLMRMDDADLAGIEPLETRYTQEYQDFLASQEAAAAGGDPSDGDAADAE